MLLFWQNTGDCTNALPGDSYFGYGEVIIIALDWPFSSQGSIGRAVCFLSRPWLDFYPTLFCSNPTQADSWLCRAFFTLGSLGLNEVLNSLFFLSKGRVISRLACLLLLGLWVGPHKRASQGSLISGRRRSSASMSWRVRKLIKMQVLGIAYILYPPCLMPTPIP